MELLHILADVCLTLYRRGIISHVALFACTSSDLLFKIKKPSIGGF